MEKKEGFLISYACKGKSIYKKKSITPGLITNYLTARGLAYWIMCDGSLQNDKKSIILHTQGFSEKVF